MAALAAALGFLAHGGVAFTLLALALFFLLPRYYIGLRRALWGCAIFAAVMAPWTLYQKLYDPPANRLLKWYLAGVTEVDSRSTWQAIKDSCGAASAYEIVCYKLENLGVLLPGTRMVQRLSYWRAGEFYSLVAALGVLNVAWLLLGLGLTSRKSPFGGDAGRPARIFLGVGLLGVLLWLLLVFGYGFTVVHQGSYATMILLFAGLANLLYLLPRRFLVAILALHAADFLVVWVLTTPETFSFREMVRAANFPMTFVAIVAVAGIAKLCMSSRPDVE